MHFILLLLLNTLFFYKLIYIHSVLQIKTSSDLFFLIIVLNHFVYFLISVKILVSRNHDSSVAETNIPDTETTFDWLDYH